MGGADHILPLSNLLKLYHVSGMRGLIEGWKGLGPRRTALMLGMANWSLVGQDGSL